MSDYRECEKMERLAGVQSGGTFATPEDLNAALGTVYTCLMPTLRQMEAERGGEDAHDLRDALFIALARDLHGRGLSGEQIGAIAEGVCQIEDEIALETPEERAVLARAFRKRTVIRGVKRFAMAAAISWLAYVAAFRPALLDLDGDGVVTAADVQQWKDYALGVLAPVTGDRGSMLATSPQFGSVRPFPGDRAIRTSWLNVRFLYANRRNA